MSAVLIDVTNYTEYKENSYQLQMDTTIRCC